MTGIIYVVVQDGRVWNTELATTLPAGVLELLLLTDLTVKYITSTGWRIYVPNDWYGATTLYGYSVDDAEGFDGWKKTIGAVLDINRRVL